MSEYKYLIDGTAIIECAKMATGWMVCRVYEDPETGEPNWDESRAFRADKIYDTPPTEVVAIQIRKLQSEVEELQSKKSELESLIKEDRSKWSEISKKCLQYKALEGVFDFVEGKITHYVIAHEYGGVLEILERSKSTCEFAERGEVRLLTLYGKSKGDLQWRLSTYTDHSGYNKKEVYPTRSLDEANEVISRLAQERFQQPPQEGVITSCEKYGIPIPTEYRRAFITNTIEGHKSIMDAELQRAKEYQQKIDALNDQLESLA